ncbi:hypothetical protein A2U01_0119321, partial [Trifolium medium]|nr:hypothetical protein [Trifolium medium]
SSDLPFVHVVLHLQMGCGRHNDQISDGCHTEDTLIQRRAVDDQELDFDRLCRFVGTDGDN